MHEVLVNCLGDLSLPRKSVVRLTDRPDMTLDVYRGRKTTIQLQMIEIIVHRSTLHKVPLQATPIKCMLVSTRCNQCNCSPVRLVDVTIGE